MAPCLILLLDYIPQWITSTRITQDQWIWEIYIFPRLVHSYAQSSLSYTGAKLWNEIPIKIRKAQSVKTFKEKLSEYYSKIQNEN